MTALSLFNFDMCIKKFKKIVYKSNFLVYNNNVKTKFKKGKHYDY